MTPRLDGGLVRRAHDLGISVNEGAQVRPLNRIQNHLLKCWT
jgi:hypothetical protein